MVDSQIQEIKDKLDILEIAKSYITNFKKSGANYFALCPFHHEKTPSFSVNPELGIFKCFGCGESGDVLTFIQKMEGVDFPQALEIAARKAGVQLKRSFSKQDSKIQFEKRKILKINSLVADFYNYILNKHKLGEKGREYAKSRGINKTLIEEFNIGYAPKSYNNLLTFLKKKGYQLNNLIKWGLIVSASGKTYDKFRSRLIFPLIDHHGDIIGFSGRTVYKNTRAPKYLHSPQTLIFDKSKFLFGLYQGKNSIRDKDFSIFTEGQLDVISSHKTSMNNVVASLGTSLTEEQLKLASRYSDHIYFCFDNDLAGENALLRSTSMAHKLDLNVKAIFIKDSKDADELINKDKSDWVRAVKDSEPIVDHMIHRLYKRLDLSELNQKEEFSKIILPLIATIPNKIEKAHYLHRVSLILNVDEDIIKEELELIPEENVDLLRINTNKIIDIIKSSENIKENYLLALVLQHINFIETSLKNIKSKYLLSPNAISVLKKLKSYTKTHKRFSIKRFLQSLKKHEVDFVQNLLLMNLDSYFENEDDFEKEIKEIFKYIRKNFLQNKIKSIKNKIELSEQSGNKKRIKSLLEELINYTDQVGKV